MSSGIQLHHGDFEIRAYRPGDEVSLNEGFNRVFGQARSLDEWHAKFGTSGLEGRIMVALDRQQSIVAQYAATASEIEIGGRTFRVAQPVDVYAIRRPDVVMSRIFKRTVDFFFESFCGPRKISLLYGFPGERALRFGELKNHYRHYKRVCVWTRPVKAPEGTARVFGNRAELAQINAFWRRSAPLHAAANRRDLRRLQDRYLGHGSGGYKFVTHTRGGLLHAWAVFALRGPTASIAELLWDGEDTVALTAVLKRIEFEAALAGATTMDAWGPIDSHIATALMQAGWEGADHPSGAYLSLMAFDPEINEPWLLNNLFYSMGDSDLV